MKKVFLTLALLLSATPAAAVAAECTPWSDVRPYLYNFYEVTEPERSHLVRNFNRLAPETAYQPDIIGYTMSGDGVHVMLIISEAGCLKLERPYPQLAVWEMMKPHPIFDGVPDKSGETYITILKQRDDLIDRLQADRPSPSPSIWDEDGGEGSGSSDGDSEIMPDLD